VWKITVLQTGLHLLKNIRIPNRPVTFPSLLFFIQVLKYLDRDSQLSSPVFFFMATNFFHEQVFFCVLLKILFQLADFLYFFSKFINYFYVSVCYFFCVMFGSCIPSPFNGHKHVGSEVSSKFLHFPYTLH
jgi:hypothetical protein